MQHVGIHASQRLWWFWSDIREERARAFRNHDRDGSTNEEAGSKHFEDAHHAVRQGQRERRKTTHERAHAHAAHEQEEGDEARHGRWTSTS